MARFGNSARGRNSIAKGDESQMPGKLKRKKLTRVIEMIVVAIIVAALAIKVFPHYMGYVEKSRAKEARPPLPGN